MYFILAAFLKIKIPLVYEGPEKTKPNWNALFRGPIVADPCSFDSSVKFSRWHFL